MLPVDTNQLQTELKKAFSTLTTGPILLHTDLSKIGMTRSPKEREQILQDYEKILVNSLEGRSLIIPTFNYDFCKTGHYDRVNDPSKVGVLSDYFRRKYPLQRTKTPIFNFVIHPIQDISLEPYKNIFGEESLFNYLKNNEGSVAFLGADFSSNTFIHYVEEMCQIGYRYPKIFKGDFGVVYRVRPLSPPHVVIYDWSRLVEDLTKENILKSFNVGHGKLLAYNALDLYNFWMQKLLHDELYLLTSESRAAVKQLAQDKGYPFTLEAFE